MPFELINSLSEPQWDTWALRFAAACPFHSASWARVLWESYNYPVACGVLRDGDRIAGLLPAMDVSSRVTGRRGVSLPFSDECAPLLSEGTALEELAGPLIDHGRQCGWDYLEIRGDSKTVPGAAPADRFTMHYLALDGTEEQQYRAVCDAQRRNIRRARRLGVEVQRSQSLDAIRTYYALHCLTRRRHGIPPQPFRFFRAIQEHIIAPGGGFVLLARFEDQWIAGAVYFHFGTNALYKFGASDLRFRNLRANSLVMWEGIRSCRQAGATQLSFGRTDPRNSGLLQFKRGWGASEVSLRYYRFGLRKSLHERPEIAKSARSGASKVLRMMPMPVFRLLSGLYRHAG